MNLKNKQIISILIYFIVSAFMSYGVIVFGNRYVTENIVDAVQTESETEIEIESETEDEIEIESEIEAESESESEAVAVTESVVAVMQTERTENEPIDPRDTLLLLFEKNAPLKWARDSQTQQFVKVYPKLAYYYKDLTTGETVTYNADEILYSASLIKAPYVYAILEENDNFEKNKQEFDEDGNMIYLEGEEKYNLDEVWTFDPITMMEDGSGEIMDMPSGTQMTWRELIEYSLLYSDNIAFAQLRERFGYTSFYKKVDELDIKGVPKGFMNLSAHDCAIFLEEIYKYFETESENAEMMRDCMTKSKHLEMICANYPERTVAHKYGWDLGAFHDMAIVFDEHPYLLVIMTDYEDGGEEPTEFIGDVVELTKEIHASLHPEAEENETNTTEADAPNRLLFLLCNFPVNPKLSKTMKIA